jgi:hypothetical protein
MVATLPNSCPHALHVVRSGAGAGAGAGADAVAGAEFSWASTADKSSVLCVEGHGDTRCRWRT